MSAASYQPPSRVQLPGFRLVCHFGNIFERDSERVVGLLEACTRCFCNEFVATRAGAFQSANRPCRAQRVSHRTRSLECVAALYTPPMPTIGNAVARRRRRTAASATGFNAGPE